LRKSDRRRPGEPLVYTIPAHRSFADALAAGLIAEHAGDPLALARGRILLPTNRAVRTVTEAFVRASGGGLVLPRLIPMGDPELDDRLGIQLGSKDIQSFRTVQDVIDYVGAKAAVAG